MITDKDKIDLIIKTLERMSWELDAEVEMAIKEGILANILYTFDKNNPVKLYEYRFWFNKNETVQLSVPMKKN
ncbi:hypothetical protein PB01_09280 [Psychrobacillus glaciei]|uniref:Uncharacterized protein n=1 Tax=Psychrobacillus glaciei TaxID=2283160 RepID=A0A5J6SM85_9BACI|nr:hypothetical protein [Psychrobacillus glaciei]QFF99008.1 hypothetical protein PB01_09280 [Psychrobacillus glaciei]